MAKIFITNTNEQKDLSIINRKSGENYAHDILSQSGVDYDNQLGNYTMTADAYDWWTDYFKNAQADADTLADFTACYNPDDVQRIVFEEWDNDGNDYGEHHNINRRAFDRIEEELQKKSC